MKSALRTRRPTLLRLLAPALLVASAVLAAPAAGATPTPVEGLWGGRSSDALPVHFEVKGGEIVNATFSFTWGFCGSFESALPNEEAIREDGSWAFLDNRGPKIEATFVSPERVEGTIVAPSRELPGCPKTEATFVAAPGPVPPPPRILIPNGHGHLGGRPDKIFLSQSKVAYIYEVRWSVINLSEARGRGTAVIHFGGRTLRRRIGIRLGQAFNRNGYRTYHHLAFTLIGTLPKGLPRFGTSPLT
jgi:hypothetical protein